MGNKEVEKAIEKREAAGYKTYIIRYLVDYNFMVMIFTTKDKPKKIAYDIRTGLPGRKVEILSIKLKKNKSDINNAFLEEIKNRKRIND